MLALAWQPVQRRREAASGQLYPWWSEATRLALTRTQWLAWQHSLPPHLRGELRRGFFSSFFIWFFFSATQIFCSYKHSLEQCGRICRPSQRRIRKSLTWSKNIVKKEQTAQSGDDLVNGSAGGGLEWVRVFSVRISYFLFFSFKIRGACPVCPTFGKGWGNVSALSRGRGIEFKTYSFHPPI